MKLLKSFIIVFSLALTLGFVSTSVIAAGPPTAASGLKGINGVQGHVTEAIAAIDAGESQEAVRQHIKVALRICKEIVGTEVLEKKRLKYSRLLKKARTALKKDKPQEAKVFLIDAKKKFETLKSLV